jgi:phenylpropionate dioxygenase-like ring-hydroxylating dioxygenase large terminal subunit
LPNKGFFLILAESKAQDCVMLIQPDLTNWDALGAQLLKVQPDPDRSLGIPPACYADEDILRQERRAVFHRGWVGLGRSDRWLQAGDYSAMDIAGIPIFVIRNKAGELKAFANSCRHRGSQMLSGSGSCSKIKCPFHWWTYDLDGKLKVYPRMEKAVDFDPAEFGLVEFPLALREGFAFINFDDEPGEIESWLAEFGDYHRPWALDGWKTTRVREFDVACNWKTFIEVFNEYYHLPMVHPDSINWLYPEPDTADDVSGQFTTQFGSTEGAAALMADTQQFALPVAPGLDGREASGTRYTWIYPNITFALSQDSMWIYQAFPITADRCHVVQTICFPAESVALDDFDERVQHYYTRIDMAVGEDLPFLEQQQIGLNSKFACQGRFAALEPSVGKFAYWYAQQLLSTLNQS